MTYDFDEVVDRRNTSCTKWDCALTRGHEPDELPLWVADMDLKTPPEVVQALHDRVDHGIFGYTDPSDSYYEAVLGWIERHHGWRPKRSWCITVPGVVYALATAVKAYTQPGDAVLIQRPVYYPFTEVVEDNGRVLANAPLCYDRAAGSYSIDMDEFARVVAQTRPKLFILCNPHNPVGRCWTPDELCTMGEVCLAHGVTVISDEIHADFVWPGHAHTVFASLSPEFAQASITCTSASKTFNLAGLQASDIVIPNAGLRRRFARQNAANGYSQCNAMGLVATEAAYRQGEGWLRELKEYLAGNLEVLQEGLAGLSELRLIDLEATYLPWIDCSGLGMSDAKLARFMAHDAKLWLDMGTMFGPEGSGFARMNIAAPRSTVERATSQLVRAVEARR